MKTPERGKELSPETLKQYKGFENKTETELLKEIEVIKCLAKILFEQLKNEPKK